MFGGPEFTGSTANQKMIMGGADQPMPDQVPYTPTPSAAVQRNDLPPPPGQVSNSSSTLLPGVQHYGGQTAQAPYNAQPAPTTLASASTPAPYVPPSAPGAHAGGWNTAGGTAVTLGTGETLSSISRRYGVPVKELAKANNITDPSSVTIGTRIIIPTYAAGAGAVASAAQTEAKGRAELVAGAAPAGAIKAAAAVPETSLNGLHLVAPGQTLSSIARLYNVSPKELAEANNLTSTNQLKSGQKLKIPGHAPSQTAALIAEPARRELKPTGEDPNKAPAAGDSATAKASAKAEAVAAVTAPPVAAPTTTASIAAPAKPDSVQPTAYAAPDAGVQKASADPTDPGSANGTSFRWPVRGRIIGSFGPSPTGDKNDGINLAVPEGTSIKAAEAGTVIYAGNELEGYGNLVLIRHANGWVSAYAHNSKILVNRGDTVRRGQIVSQAGTSGSVSAPQLHFELRKGSKPVNPLDYLQG
jgi:murein DD-endopeptidase MepM/ murein hydrolase activator NlpD